MTDAPTIYEALAKARLDFQMKADFRKVKGDGLKFAYLPIEQAKPVIEAVTAANGITILPLTMELDDATREWDKASQYGGGTTHWTQIRATVRFLLACGPGGDQRITLDVVGEAMDNSDKAVNKVYTMAYKNLVKIVFGFAESSKDDGDATQETIPATIHYPSRKSTTPPSDPFFKTAKADLDSMDRQQLLTWLKSKDQNKVKATAEMVLGPGGSNYERLDRDSLLRIAKEVKA